MTVREKSYDVYQQMTADQKDQVKEIATRFAKARLKIGDRVSRTMCADLRGTFNFTGWYGVWACGKTVDDCHAFSILKINGVAVDFRAEALAEFQSQGVK